jgi:putative membrane protein
MKTKKKYDNEFKQNMILRDELAIDRTALANERTLLAYLRSAIALVIAGVSIIHFSEQSWFWVVGLTCIPIGIATGILGLVRFRRMRRSIDAARDLEQSDVEQSLRTDA